MKKLMNNEFPLILLDNVSYKYTDGTLALKSINLNVYRGEIIGLMGQNGAGKTTLIRTLNGLVRPTIGKIFFEGKNISTKSVGFLSKKVGIIFQNPNHQVFSNSVEEEIKFSLSNLGLSKEDIKKYTGQILKKFDFEKYKDRSPFNLSGGEKKKLAMASILCRNPDVLVFDEPTLGQDAKEIDFLISLINEEKRKNKTIVIVTHNIEFAFENIPRIILMVNGRIIADGPTHKVLTNSQLVNKSSLILPQVSQMKRSFDKIGIRTPQNIYSIKEMKIYLAKCIKNITL